MKVLGIIPARGGSKGLPGKNLLPVAGVSLVGRAVLAGEALRARPGIEARLLVDTDDEAIAAEGRRWGAWVPFLRPAELAADQTPMIDNVLHAVERAAAHGFVADVVVLLQPTSPQRTGEDVLACLAALEPGRVESAVTVTENDHPAEQTFRMAPDGTLTWAWPDLTPDARRQDLPLGFRPNGAVYANTVALLRARRSFLLSGVTRGVVMPRGRSIDVDTAADLAMAEALAAGAPVRDLVVAGRSIGAGHPCFVIAEAGVNHNGDMALAHRLVDVAADAGADAVKFQTFDPAKLVSRAAPMAAYQEENTGKRESQADMLQRLVLPRAAHAELMEHARQRGLIFLSTPFDEGSADFLDELGVPAFKIPSGEITNHPFLRHVGAKRKPMLISSGMADLQEVLRAVGIARATGAPSVGTFHCVTSYPAFAEDCNLRAMDTMRAALGVPTGWSDHTEGIALSLAAVARGATLLEKHYTLDRHLPGPDHKASLEPGELKEMVQGVRAIESALGDGIKRPRPREIPLIAAARKSLHAARALPEGHLLAASDLIALRPGTGISPANLEQVVGRRLARPLHFEQLLAEDDLA